VVFKRIGVSLPFSRFEREVLTKINVAPTQLYPNSWTFFKAFDILFGFLGCAPSVDIFLHFFEVKRQRNNLWVTLSNVPGSDGKFHEGLLESCKIWCGSYGCVCARSS